MTTLNAPNATENALRRYFVLPDEVSKIGFVHKINQEATSEEVFKTVTDYQVTPSIQQNLDRALGYANKSLNDHASMFTWVHGSFGCGKSHFMNMLSLMMAGEVAVYQEHPELQKQKLKYEDGVLQKKLFRLHVHCISRTASTLEEIVFGAAVDAIKKVHPDAGLPALFQWQELFEAAKEVRKGMGDEAFFKAISPADDNADNDGWPKEPEWNAERFDKAIKDAATPEGEALLKALTASKMLGKVAEGSGFIAIGPGLKALASFLNDLGYDGVVLFLDELVLWLSTLRENKDKLNEQTKRVVTLVEHGDFRPVIPFVTFAARQRALSEMVGTFAEGEGEKVFEDQLSYWKDRFEVINLEDKDLPRIIEKRILKPKSDATKAELDAAFDGFQQRFKKDFRKLTGDQGDVDDFRRVYPFSPALIEVLVALSASLQRDRTALRELSRMMVEYLPDFQPGKVIPVGDLFDVVVHGDASDVAAMRRLYTNASRIYKDELLPLIQESNGTSRDGRCQLLSDEFDGSLGCSGCQEQSCRAQTRIAKTVLLQGLVPNTPVLKDLDAQTLVNLNAGAVKSVVPNQEIKQVTNMLRSWAAESAAIHLQGESNPTVKAVLETIDTRRIIESALEYDNQRRRQIRVRDVLFAMMGIQTKGQDAYRNVEWSGRKWKVGVVYTNTRTANDATFRCADNEDLRLIIDYPFDDAGHTPEEDEKTIAQAMDNSPTGFDTLVWLPSFVTARVQRALGDLVVLDGLLGDSNEQLQIRLSWISSDDLPRARAALEQQKGFKEAAVKNALLAAYGIVGEQFKDLLAPGLAPKKKVHLMVPDSNISMPLEGDAERCFEGLVHRAFEVLAPRHPQFTKPPTPARLRSVLGVLQELVQNEGQRMVLAKNKADEVRSIAAVKHFEMVRMNENEVVFAEGVLQHLGKAVASTKNLSVGAVKAAIDPNGLMRLDEQLKDFVVLAFAETSNPPLQLMRLGEPVLSSKLGSLEDAYSLVAVELPSQVEWSKALDVAGILGITLGGRALSPAKMDALAEQVKAKAATLENAGMAELVSFHAQWCIRLGIDDDANQTPRGNVLSLLQDLVQRVDVGTSFEVAQALATFEWDAKQTTALTHMASGDRIKALLKELQNQSNVDAVDKSKALQDEGNVREVLDALREALRSDENLIQLRPALTDANQTIINALFKKSEETKPAPVEPIRGDPVAGEPSSAGDISVHEPAIAQAMLNSANATTTILASAKEVKSAVAEIEALVWAGKRVRLTYEVIEDGESSQ